MSNYVRKFENHYKLAYSFANMESVASDEPMGKKENKGLDSRINIHVKSYRRFKHDPDNISAKAALDGIVKAGILPDDSTREIKKITFESIKSKEEKTIIEITCDD